MRRSRWLVLPLGLLGLYAVVAAYFSSVIVSFETRTLAEDQQHRGIGGVEDYGLPPPEDIRFDGPDGRLSGWWFTPEDPGCAAVLLHGYRGTRWGALEYSQLVWHRGCAVLAYDHRRHGHSFDSHGTFGIRERDDLVAAVDWVTARTGLPRDRIGVYGESYGASTALLAAPLLTDIAFIGADAPYSGLSAILTDRGETSYGPAIRLVIPAAIAISGLRAGFPLGGFDIPSELARGAPPLFVSHSLSDDETPPAHSARIGLAMDKGRGTVRLTDWGSRHGRCIEDDLEAYRSGFDDFLARFVPDFPGTSPGAGVPALEEVEPLLDQVSPERLHTDVAQLVSFGTRHTLSDPNDPVRGIGAARRWVHEVLSGLTGLQVRLDPHRIEPDGRRIPEPTDVVNVVATKPGTTAQAQHLLVLAHLDSRATDPLDASSDAPGANDDASGVALVLELARVLAEVELERTVHFVATSGEEQGLHGARGLAADAAAEGWDIRGVLSSDIVGAPGRRVGVDTERWVRVFSPGGDGGSASRELARTTALVGAAYDLPVQPMLIWRADRMLRGGDHSAFTAHAFPGLRFTVVEEDYTRQHQDVRTAEGIAYGDVLEHIDADYLAGVTRLNLATLVHLANAPSPPQVRLELSGLSRDTTVTWSPAPEADVVGYEVLWRATTAPQWQHALALGEVTEATLPLNKDNVIIGVRAVDSDGYRSPAAVARP